LKSSKKFVDWLEDEVANAKSEMKEALTHLDHDRAQIKYVTLLKAYNKTKELAL
jgi:hypothetical protein